MKNYTLLILVCCLACRISAQDSSLTQLPKVVLPANEYRQKMTDHLVFGSLALAGGTILYFTGKNAQEKATGFDFTGSGIAAVGIVIAAGSIPLFIGAGHYHRKLKSVSAGMRIENASGLRQLAVFRQSFPALAIRIGL